MYQKKLMELYQDTQWRGAIPGANFKSQKYNPSCGDEIAFSGMVKEGVLITIRYEGAGCILSQAVAAYLCSYAQNKPLIELTNLTIDAILADLELSVGPNRLQCVELVLTALQEAVASYHAQ